MRRSTLSLVVALVTPSLWCQAQPASKWSSLAIQRAKNVMVSSLDARLPKVTLEFFLKSESEGSPVTWSVSDCDEQVGNGAGTKVAKSTACVVAEISFKDLRSATLVLSMRTTPGDTPLAPDLLRVTTTDQSGKINLVRHLGDLPMELHRPQPRTPKDFPEPVATIAPVPACRRPVARYESKSLT